MISTEYLVSGGSGALGRELVASVLAEDADARITLLLRASSPARVQDRLHEIRQYLAAYCPGPDTRRVDAVRGDVTLPRLGLTRGVYEDLARRATHVIHAAASIHLGQALDAARWTNVHGTHEVLRFARRCARLVTFAHVSTAWVAGDREGRILETDFDRGQGFLNAYERSKWEAERLVRAATAELPVLVFRPGLVVGHSADGHLSCLSTIYMPLRAIVTGRVAAIPGSPDTRLDLVPVDYVAGVIARLSRAPQRTGRTYHVCAGPERSIRADRLVESACEFFCDQGRGERGLRFTTPPVAGPRADRAEADAAGNLGAFFSYLSLRKSFDDTNVREDLGSACPEPPAAEAILPALFTYCRETAWGAIRPWVNFRETREESCARPA